MGISRCLDDDRRWPSFAKIHDNDLGSVAIVARVPAFSQLTAVVRIRFEKDGSNRVENDGIAENARALIC